MSDFDTQQIHDVVDQSVRSTTEEMHALVTPTEESLDAPRVYTREEIVAWLAQHWAWFAIPAALIVFGAVYGTGFLRS